MVTAIIAFGGNLILDNVPIRDRLQGALQEFCAHRMNITAVSRWYQTPAYPAGAGQEFLNGVVRVETALAPEGILAALGRIEAGQGRVRNARWEARVVDLDVIAVDDLVLPDRAEQSRWRELTHGEQQALTPREMILPHPRLQDRSFVLYPLRDVAPGWVHPVTGRSVEQMIADLPAALRAEIRVAD